MLITCHFAILWLFKNQEYCTLVFQLEFDSFCPWPHIQAQKWCATLARVGMTPGSSAGPCSLPIFLSMYTVNFISFFMYFHCPYNMLLLLFLNFSFQFLAMIYYNSGRWDFSPSLPGASYTSAIILASANLSTIQTQFFVSAPYILCLSKIVFDPIPPYRTLCLLRFRITQLLWNISFLMFLSSQSLHFVWIFPLCKCGVMLFPTLYIPEMKPKWTLVI